MLRAKAVKFKKGDVKLRDKILTSTDRVGSLAGLPVVAASSTPSTRRAWAARPWRRCWRSTRRPGSPSITATPCASARSARIGKRATGEAAGPTTGKVALFATCYGNYNEPGINDDLIAVFEHNGIPVTLAEKEQCCGMPKLELGDLEAVKAAKEANIPVLKRLVDDGWDLVAMIPSCVLMFKQELPLLFPDDPDVQAVKEAMYDPFEYLMLRHKHGKMNLDFKKPLGSVVYQASCHQRVQNIGQKTREVLALVPDTKVEIIERCSGHDGTYAVKKESYARP
jgi:glycerol-3-phosphate dehydrogenase subunit C